MASSAKEQIKADLFGQLWSSSDLNPDRITNELSKIFTENNEETNHRNDSKKYFNFNEQHAQSSDTAASASLKAKIPLVAKGDLNLQASHKQQSSGASAKTTHNVISKQDIENYFKREGIDTEWKGEKFVTKSFTVNKLTDITDRLQVALVARQLIAESSSGAEVKMFNVIDVPVPGKESHWGSIIFTGEIRLYSGKAQPPTPWLLCDGAAVSRSEYSRLFDVIGEEFGRGDGRRTFNLPDFRGRFAVGCDQLAARFGQIVSLGSTGGGLSHRLTVENLPKHRHNGGSLHTDAAGNHTHSINDPSRTHQQGHWKHAKIPEAQAGFLVAIHTILGDQWWHRHSITTTNDISVDDDGIHEHTVHGETGSTGGGQPINITPPYQAIKYIIYAA